MLTTAQVLWYWCTHEYHHYSGGTRVCKKTPRYSAPESSGYKPCTLQAPQEEKGLHQTNIIKECEFSPYPIHLFAEVCHTTEEVGNPGRGSHTADLKKNNAELKTHYND